MLGESGHRERVEHAVVVLSWNGKTDTLACVDSLVTGSPGVTIIVVDNGSYDGVLDVVHERWPDVQTLQTGMNLGFAGGMNAGISRALDLGAEYVTILNNDTLVSSGAITELRLSATAGIAVSPMVMYRDSAEAIWFGGGTLDERNGFPFHTPPAEFSPCHAGLRRTRLLAGCCITASREVWLKVGLFDERYFLYFEDSEWSMRAAARGIDLAVACETHILHAVSASFTGAAATLGTFYYVRNGLLFNRMVGASLASRVRFLRRRALPGLKQRTARDAARSALVIGWAVAAYCTHQYGAAPKLLQALARSWNASRELEAAR